LSGCGHCTLHSSPPRNFGTSITKFQGPIVLSPSTFLISLPIPSKTALVVQSLSSRTFSRKKRSHSIPLSVVFSFSCLEIISRRQVVDKNRSKGSAFPFASINHLSQLFTKSQSVFESSLISTLNSYCSLQSLTNTLFYEWTTKTFLKRMRSRRITL